MVIRLKHELVRSPSKVLRQNRQQTNFWVFVFKFDGSGDLDCFGIVKQSIFEVEGQDDLEIRHCKPVFSSYS